MVVIVEVRNVEALFGSPVPQKSAWRRDPPYICTSMVFSIKAVTMYW